RGIRKEAVDLWLRDLGADVGNLRAWKAGTIGWPEMKRRYLAGLAAPEAAAALERLSGLARRRRVTLLCSCPEEDRCHRGLLKSLLAGARAGRAGASRARYPRRPGPRARARS